MTKYDHVKDRTKLIAETLESLKAVRENIHPDVLEEAKASIFTTNEQIASDEIRIDRPRNVKFVMDFLNSPEGAHLKEKIMP